MYANKGDSTLNLDVEYLPTLCTRRFREYDNFHERIIANFLQVTGQETARVRSKYNVRQERYGGTDDNQLMDIYYKDNENDSPIFVYLHGGYWQMLDKSTSGSFVEPLIAMGYRVLVVDYNLCPQVTLAQLMAEARGFFQWLNLYSHRTNANSVSLAGHSAGAHLITTFLQEPLLQIDRLCKVFLISGVYDLRELYKLASVNTNNLYSLDNVQQAELLSPICWQTSGKLDTETHWHVLVGRDESATFIAQSKEYATKLQNIGFHVDFHIMDYDHFNIIECVPVEGSDINAYLKKQLGQSADN